MSVPSGANCGSARPAAPTSEPGACSTRNNESNTGSHSSDRRRNIIAATAKNTEAESTLSARVSAA